MSDMIQKMVGWSVQDLQSSRANALGKLDDPKLAKRAEEVLTAIEFELERRALPGMIDTFKKEFPGGFYGEAHDKTEYIYKSKASALCLSLFERNKFRSLIDQSEWSELIARLKKTVSATNLIQASFEVPKLLRTVETAENTGIFFEALYANLWGDGEMLDRFDSFCKVLASLDLAKWTYASYFNFLAFPDTCMFVKPTMLKKCLEISNHWMTYESTPSGKKYGEILAYTQWLFNRIQELKPRDMIDLHSFMWYMAPTGKWADE